MSKFAKKIVSWIIILWWVIILQDTDSFYSVYILVGIVGAVAVQYNEEKNNKISKRFFINLSALIFPIIVVLSNYNILTPIKDHIIKLVFIFASSYLLSRNIIIAMSAFFCKYKGWKIDKSRIKPRTIFLICFIVISVLYGTFLIVRVYPGVLTSDSLTQCYQALHQITSNHHPFYHTLLIRILLNTGMLLFGDINGAVALYSFVSLFAMAGIFSFTEMTLYEMTGSKIAVILTCAMYSIIPYHIVYSVTMWKDVLFAGSVLLFIVSVIRFFFNVGGKRINTICLLIGGALFALFRSNGWVALLITFLAILVLWRPKRFVILMIMLLSVTFILKHPILSVLNVKQPDIVEFLSIPEQQIARVVAEGVELTEDEINMIAKVTDIESLPTDYNPHISDPVKGNIRRNGAEYLDQNRIEYLKLWLQLGIKYPTLYLESWVDQTKGFWSGGYKYWIWSLWLGDAFTAAGVQRSISELGIVQSPYNCFLTDAFSWWFKTFENEYIFEPLRSIGLHVWIFMFSLLAAIISKRKEIILISIPVIAVVFTLLITTPIFSEFRYAYSVFVITPMLIGFIFSKRVLNDGTDDSNDCMLLNSNTTVVDSDNMFSCKGGDLHEDT